ncbi:ATP-binding protein [Aliiglaciecola sp. CAU 1673]|uniref:ATP-binding protein n=1 Tax=Aliiglaciecola sp. CAU 1673 TaxID=3032595 RepID=UPI0023DBE9A1|nr:ATP-binding protein [Aliiglaciecola sp. CAU 1673]MDF2180105.1 ATP-binding protein [Aliiglaciecola sp. CAU 1673]
MGIQNKVFGVFLLASAFLALGLVLLVQWSLDRGMLAYVNKQEVERMTPLVTALADFHQRQGNWRRLEDNNRAFRRLVEQSIEGPMQPPPPRAAEREPQRRPPPNQRPVAENNPPPPHPLALLDAAGEHLVGHYPPDRQYHLLPIEQEGELVGYLAVAKRDRLADGYELNFVTEQQTNLLWLALLLLVFVWLISLPLARHLVGPIRRITAAMSQLTKGQYQLRLRTDRKDEIGILTADFNQLAETLESNEASRRRWLADISHELRTPVAVLKGELEAIQDGIRPLNQEQIASLQEEVIQLQQLIEDLHQLNTLGLGDRQFQMGSIDITAFVQSYGAKQAELLKEQGIELSLQLPGQSIKVKGDTARLRQVLDNLFANLRRYADGANQARLCLTSEGEQAKLVVEDNGIGVPSQHLNHLFDPLYRVDSARNRQQGGSGLGLAICRQIIEAHGGQIDASASTLGGLAITLWLPLD